MLLRSLCFYAIYYLNKKLNKLLCKSETINDAKKHPEIHIFSKFSGLRPNFIKNHILNKVQKNNTYAEKLFILAINSTTYLAI